jgi:hypothetical protein
MIVLKLLLIGALGVIFYQDQKDRMVYWFLYPIVGVVGFCIQLYFVLLEVLVLNSLINLTIIATLLAVLWVYSKIIRKQSLINNGMGLGDVLFFVFLSFCFPIVTFIVLFVFSLLFSLLLHFFIKNKNSTTIPLAGFMSLFFAFVYGLSFFESGNFIFLY